MKLVFAIKTLKMVKGGAERVLVDVVSEMARRGHQVCVITFDSTEGQTVYELDHRVRQKNIGVGNAREKTTIIEFLRRLPRLRRAIRNENPDVVIGFMHSMYVPLAFALIGSNLPVLASEHVVPDYYQNRRFEYWLLVLSSFFIKKFSVILDRIGAFYPSVLQNKIVSLPDPVTQATRYVNHNGKADKPKTILNVGRLIDSKDHKTLISAFAEIADEYPKWHLRIVGEGELRKELEDQVFSCGLQDRIELPGASNDIESEYLNAHIFVTPSIHEGFGLVTAEASAHGLPVIGFYECIGSNEIISDGITGKLVNSENRVKSLATSLSSMINNGHLREKYGLAGREKMRQYSLSNVVNKWEEELTRLAGSHTDKEI